MGYYITLYLVLLLLALSVCSSTVTLKIVSPSPYQSCDSQERPLFPVDVVIGFENIQELELEIKFR